eukprot:scaffold240728_cov33-Tisochrysis_lutea.AAC.1
MAYLVRTDGHLTLLITHDAVGMGPWPSGAAMGSTVGVTSPPPHSPSQRYICRSVEVEVE